MTYTTTINGVTLTMNPAVAQTLGPSGAPIQFTSQIGTTSSKPILVQVVPPCKEFGVTVVGQTHPDSILRAYTSAGIPISEVRGTPSVPDLGKGGSPVILKIVSNSAGLIARVDLIPPANDYVGYRDLVIVPNSSITPPPPVPDVDLATLVLMDITDITRQYIKGSMQGIEPQFINFTNTSTDTEVQLTASTINGIKFTPFTFPLSPGQRQTMKVEFDFSVINNWPEAKYNLQSAIVVTKPTVSTPPPPAPTSWLEERYNISPLAVSEELGIFKRVPTDEEFNTLLSKKTPIIRPVTSINYSSDEGTALNAPITVRWSQNMNVPVESDYLFEFTTDDGMRVFIDDVLVSNKWFAQAKTNYNFRKRLLPGTHKIKVEYFNDRGTSVAKFNYKAVPDLSF